MRQLFLKCLQRLLILTNIEITYLQKKIQGITMKLVEYSLVMKSANQGRGKRRIFEAVDLLSISEMFGQLDSWNGIKGIKRYFFLNLITNEREKI